MRDGISASGLTPVDLAKIGARSAIRPGRHQAANPSDSIGASAASDPRAIPQTRNSLAERVIVQMAVTTSCSAAGHGLCAPRRGLNLSARDPHVEIRTTHDARRAATLSVRRIMLCPAAVNRKGLRCVGDAGSPRTPGSKRSASAAVSANPRCVGCKTWVRPSVMIDSA
jgi:hypothetical protein